LNETAKIRTDFEDLAALVETYGATIRRELLEIQTEVLEIRTQGFMKALIRETPNSVKFVTDVVRSRISLIRKDLEKPLASSGPEERLPRESKDDSQLPAEGSPLRDKRLRESQVNSMITRVRQFLTYLDSQLELVT